MPNLFGVANSFGQDCSYARVRDSQGVPSKFRTCLFSLQISPHSHIFFYRHIVSILVRFISLREKLSAKRGPHSESQLSREFKKTGYFLYFSHMDKYVCANRILFHVAVPAIYGVGVKFVACKHRNLILKPILH